MTAMTAMTGREAGWQNRFRLRHFVEALGRAGELDRVSEPLDLIEVGRRLEGNPRAVLFDSVGPERAQLAGNVMGSRERLALALGVESGRLLAEVLERFGRPQPPVSVPADEAPVQEVVQLENEVDLTTLPVHLQHEGDGAPYISAAIDMTRRREGEGHFNVGCRRLMLRGPRETGVDLNAPSDLRIAYQQAAARGDAVPIAFAIGSHPADFLGGTMSGAGDELALLGGIRGAPVPLVPAVSQDLLVPADAEMVLEGYLGPEGYIEREGPYGEYLGYDGGVKRNPVFHVTALTRRSDFLFQTVTISGRHLVRTDTAQLGSLATEVGLWRSLLLAVREPVAVHASAASGGMYNARISLRQHSPGEARNAIAAAFSTKSNVKHVFVVDDDVDIFSDEQMEWALATRFQADRDLLVGSGFRAVPLDPSLGGSPSGAKAGFDLTRPVAERDAPRWRASAAPLPDGDGPVAGDVASALRDGPRTFRQLMAARGSRDGRDVLRELAAARAEGRVELGDDGRYALTEAGHRT
jgi:2,5-furandicarboxylate decarboxylase 1